MDHLNYFNPYDRDATHEDQLTRAFLAVLRLVPLARTMFVDLIRKRQSQIKGCCQIPATAEPEAGTCTIQTQVTSLESYSGHLVSILMTNEPWNREKVVVRSDRTARYDGVISYAPGYVLVIENKPRNQDVWQTQLDPNVGTDDDLEVDPNPVVILWRDVIEGLSLFLRCPKADTTLPPPLDGAQAMIINDFLNFAWENFSFLNPYHRLDLCKNDMYLLRSRCRQIIDDTFAEGSAYHRGWEDFLALRGGAAAKATLHPVALDEGDWAIVMAVYPGDTVKQARKLYDNLERDALLQLAETPGCCVRTNLHFAFVGTNLVWAEQDPGLLSLADYVDYWMAHRDAICQVPRESGFQSLFEELRKARLISEGDVAQLTEVFTNTHRQHVRVCPGLAVEFTWSSQVASRLDNAPGDLVREVTDRMRSALSTWRQEMPETTHPGRDESGTGEAHT